MAPDVEYGKFFRAETKEDDELFPRVFDMFKALPGARFLEKAANGRQAVLYKGMLIVDTRTLPYLGGCSPDLTLVRDGCSVLPSTVLALLELQVGGCRLGVGGCRWEVRGCRWEVGGCLL